LPVKVRVDLARFGGSLERAEQTLASETGFRADPGGGAIRKGAGEFYGTFSPSGFRQALRRRGVLRVELGSEPPARAEDAGTTMEVGLRVPAGEAPMAALEALAPRLRERAGFVVTRVLGHWAVPGTGETALLVEGRLPIRSVEALLADPDVLRASPAPERRADSAPVRPRQDLWEFLLRRRPWLTLGLGLLLARLARPLRERMFGARPRGT
jgi:hypothetical protein